jgi:hypothetical protein
MIDSGVSFYVDLVALGFILAVLLVGLVGLRRFLRKLDKSG